MSEEYFETVYILASRSQISNPTNQFQSHLLGYFSSFEFFVPDTSCWGWDFIALLALAMAAWFHKRRHEHCMRLTLKLLPCLYISILFDLIFAWHVVSKTGKGHLKRKRASFLECIMASGRLFCSYLRVNQVCQQDIACVTTCMFFLNRKNNWKIPTVAPFFTLKFIFFWKSSKMLFQEKQNATFMLFFFWNVEMLLIYIQADPCLRGNIF